MQLSSALALAAWLGWTAWVAVHALARPDELLVFVDGPLDALPFWRDAAAAHARALAGAALALLAAWGIGSPVARRLLPGATPAEHLLTGFITGFTAIGTLSGALALLHLYRAGAVAALLIGGAAIALVRLRFGAPRWRDTSPSAAGVVFGGCAVLAAGAAFIGALAPESEYDALWYHLWLPVRWLEAGTAVDIVEEYVSLYPLTWDLVGGAAMVAGGPVAAKLLHWACLPLTGLAAFLLARRLVPDARPALAAALAMVTPITIWEATTAYVDLALTVYVAASVYALVRFDESQDRRWLWASAAMMGGALAVKHLALVALAIVTLVLGARVWRVAGRPLPAARVMLLYVTVALLLPAPWYARAYAASGNPVFPDLYAVFGARPPERWSPATERGLQAFKDRFGRERTPANLARLPWDATVHAARYGGTLGPLFLMLVPAAIVGRGVRRKALVLAGGCAAYLAVWASPVSSFQMRFVIPLVPFLALLAAEGARRIEEAARDVFRAGALLVTGLIAALLLFNLPPASGWHEPDRVGWDGWMTHIMHAMPARVVLGAESREAYLARTVPSYRAWRFMQSLPADARVLTFSGGDHLYATRARIRSDATIARAATSEAAPGQEEKALDALHRLALTYVLFDKRQVEHGAMAGLAIASSRMRACCLEQVYEDERFVLYRIRGGISDPLEPPGSGTGGEEAAPLARAGVSDPGGLASGSIRHW